MNKLLKSVLQTVVYLLEQTERTAGDVRDRVSDGVDRVSDRVSDLRDRAQDIYSGSQDHTLRNVLTFAAGIGVGVATAMLFAPASGEEIRSQIGEKVQDIGGRVRDRFSSEQKERGGSATGTEGV
ncbi:MAG TPA: YtxH domain-containing protein [Candidatus Aquilonibacter sp.]|nr:YtxH domain-containing protein [Candidatus Aquilonibacter sp.]